MERLRVYNILGSRHVDNVVLHIKPPRWVGEFVVENNVERPLYSTKPSCWDLETGQSENPEEAVMLITIFSA